MCEKFVESTVRGRVTESHLKLSCTEISSSLHPVSVTNIGQSFRVFFKTVFYDHPQISRPNALMCLPSENESSPYENSMIMNTRPIRVHHGGAQPIRVMLNQAYPMVGHTN